MLDLVITILSMQSVAIVTIVVCTQFIGCCTNTDILASSDDTVPNEGTVSFRAIWRALKIQFLMKTTDGGPNVDVN